MAGLNDNTRGALLMVISMLSFTTNDTLIKLALRDLPLFQSIFIRGCCATLILGLIAWRMGQLGSWPTGRDRTLMLARTLCEALGTWCFFTALQHMPQATLTAIVQTAPLTITLGAALVLNERVGWRRINAILIGFAGVLLIVRPGANAFGGYAIFALGALACVTVRDLCARAMSPVLPSVLAALAVSAGLTVFAGVGSGVEGWQPVSAPPLLFIALAGLCIVSGFITAVSAMRVGEIGAVAPFRYTSLVAALILGLLVFGEWPDALTLVGAALIVASGLFTLYRGRKTGAAAVAQAAEPPQP